MSKSDGGKGSTPRPFSVAQAEYDARWDMIFGRDKGDKERDRREDALAEVQRLGQEIQPDMEIEDE